MLKQTKIFIFLVLFFIQLSNSKDLINFEIFQIKTGSLKVNEYDYYVLTLPNDIDKDNHLIIELEANRYLDAVNKILSDPNLYISMTDKMPSVVSNTWKCERFGEETISISPSFLKPSQTFYISVFCKDKCNYLLRSRLAKDIALKEKEMNIYNLNPNTVTKFSFTTKEDFKELSVNVVGSYINSFEAYLAKDNPSSSNTLVPNSILFNGYRFIIPKLSNEKELNTNTQYSLIVDNDDEKQDLIIWLQYDNENILIKEADILYDSISENKAHCYYYPIDYFNKNKDIIISTTLFNGQGFIHMAGFNSINANSIKPEDKNKVSNYKVIQSKVIKLTSSDLRNFGKYVEDGQTFLNFCFYAEKDTSLSFRAYFLENYKRLQALNTIYAGIELEDIIPNKSLKKYKLEHFNIEQDMSIFLYEKTGKTKLYLFMAKPEEENTILSNDDFENLKKKDQVIEAQYLFNSYYLYLTKEANKCIQNPTTGLYSCYLDAIVECQSEEDDCIFSLFFDHSKADIFIQPNQIYTSVISEDEFDIYRIVIPDSSVKNLVIVLMQNTGKTLLRMESIANEMGYLDINEEMQNKEFLPNLMKISSERLHLENLRGTFTLKVKGLSYASYSLYYYTFDEMEDSEALDQDKISMKLEKGKIIRDIFMDIHRFKVYMYDNSMGPKNNLFIGIVETDYTNLELYVFKDLNDFRIYKDIISGYLWKGDYRDYIYIDKNDEKYIKNDILYILVFKKATYYSEINNKESYCSFYLAITDENTPLLLNEGVEFKYQLNQEHTEQKFYYYYLNEKEDKKDLQISLSLFYGHIIVKVNIENELTFAKYIQEESSLITVEYNDIYIYCKNKNTCGIEIEVINDDSFLLYSSFLISVRSGKNIPFHLQQGKITKRTILSGEDQHFIIDLKAEKPYGAKISAMFTNGQGEMYARRALRSDMFDKLDFPDENNYEYKVTYRYVKNDFYLIEIPYNDFGEHTYCQLLLTVRGIFPGYFYTRIEYSISVSSSMYDIIPDKSYKLFISQGEIANFHFKIGINKKRLYISMTNKDKDAVMYLTNDPSITNIYEYKWKSSGGYNEYIDISINDQYFSERGLTDLDGDYYLSIQGIEDTFYNLYISSQDVKFITLSEAQQGTCLCETENDSCYFRYENLKNSLKTNLYEKKIIFYTEFTYGSGLMQAKLYKNGNMEDILSNLPSQKNNDIFIENASEFLIMDINRSNPNYTPTSVIVVGVQCKEKSLFDLSIALLDSSRDSSRYQNNLIFLTPNDDNIFYLSSTTGIYPKFIYYIFTNEDLTFKIKSLYGHASIRAYTNETLENYKFTEGEENIVEEFRHYHHIANFEIDSNTKGKNEYFGKVIKTFGYKNYFYLEVKPYDDSLININVYYANEMIKIPLNKEITDIINEYNYNAYYDFDKDIDEVIITITSLEKNRQYNVYLKTNIIYNINVRNNTNRENKYSMASSHNYDLKGRTNELTSAISLRIKNAPKTLRDEFQLVRILINIESDYYSYNNKIKLLVTPVINNITKIKPEQNIYYFSGLEKKLTERVVFTLKNKDKEDDLMIIEISSCKGNYFYVITDSPPLDSETYNQLLSRKVQSKQYSSNGKKIITITDIGVKEYYLTLFGINTKINVDLFIHEEIESSQRQNVDVLFYYYTTRKKYYNYLVTQDSLLYESNDKFYSVKLTIPELKKRDIFGKENYADSMNYTFIVSDKKKDYSYMESTCYLTKLQQSNQNKKYDYLNIKYDKKTNSFYIKGFESGKVYYMNILAKNEITGEVITYKPVMIVSSMAERKVKIFAIIFLSIVMIVFVCVAFRIYRKYKIRNMQLQFVEENNNIDNTEKKIKQLKNINLDFVKKNDNQG